MLHQAQLLQRLKLQEFGAAGCTKLLYSTGEIGCAGIEHFCCTTFVHPLHHSVRINCEADTTKYVTASEADALLAQVHGPEQHVQQEAVVVLTESFLDPFLLQLQKNVTLQFLVKGILVTPTGKLYPLISSDIQCCSFHMATHRFLPAHT